MAHLGFISWPLVYKPVEQRAQTSWPLKNRSKKVESLVPDSVLSVDSKYSHPVGFIPETDPSCGSKENCLEARAGYLGTG